jgi:hypothetical protein
MIPPKKQKTIFNCQRGKAGLELVFCCNDFRTSAFSDISALRIRNIDGKIVAITLPDTICARP